MLEIGSSLRQARTGAGLELPEVEAVTMIPARYLDALENEQFDRLPLGPYRRSFLREYAEFLGLDADVFVVEYLLRFSPPEPEPPHPPPRPDFAWLLAALSPTRVAVVALVVLVGVAVWQLGGSSGKRAVKPPAVTTTTSSRVRTTTRTSARSHRAAAVGPTRSPALRPALTLTAARGACWLSVQIGSSTGAALYVRTLQPGQSVRFGLRKPLWIRLGAPWNVDATIGRRSVTSALPPRTGDVVATSAGLQPTT
jgi:Helix-turn-helix domain/RodZ C-terminal domain